MSAEQTPQIIDGVPGMEPLPAQAPSPKVVPIETPSAHSLRTGIDSPYKYVGQGILVKEAPAHEVGETTKDIAVNVLGAAGTAASVEQPPSNPAE